MKRSLIFILILTFSGTLLGQTSIYDETNDLSEADEANSEHYVHGGLAEKEYMKKCVGEDGVAIDQKCMESNKAFEESDKFMAGLEDWMPMVSQAYSMFALIPGMNKVPYSKKQDGHTLYKGEGDKAYAEKDGKYYKVSEGKISQETAIDGGGKPEDAKRDTKEGTDFCGYIPMVTETAATFSAQSNNQQIEANAQAQTGSTAAQADAFYAMADVQKNLRQSSQMQAIGWGSTAACYTTLMLTGTMAPKANPIVKASAATLLGTYYLKKAMAHNERKKAYEKLAEGFPKAGQCNPYTRTTCFCMEKTSQASDPTNYQRFCVPKDLHSAAPNAVSCVTQDFKPDPACSCKAKGTCVQARIASIGAQIGLTPTTMSGQFQAIKPFGSGFLGSDFDGSAQKNLAFAKKGIAKIPTTKVNFTDDKQKDLTKKLIGAGLPKFGAANLAVAKGSNPLPSSFSRGYTPSRSYSKSKPSSNVSSDTPRFKRGGDVNGSSKRRSSRSRSRRSRGGGGAKAIEIQDFASQAQKRAMERAITTDKSKPIFDIITYRYKTSAWREFREQIQKEMKEVKE